MRVVFSFRNLANYKWKQKKNCNLMEILILQILPRFIIACESGNVAQQYKRKNSKEFKLSWKSQESWKEWEWEIKFSHDKASICSANGVKQTKAKIGYQVISNLYWHATNVGRSIRYTKMVSNLVILELDILSTYIWINLIEGPILSNLMWFSVFRNNFVGLI